MPTGYTADVGDGKVSDLRTFVLRCARNFGACIMQRDEPSNAEPRLVEPSDFYGKSLAEAKADLARYQSLNAEEAGRLADAEYAKAVEDHERYRAKRRTTRDRYEAMIWRVEQWTPPTKDHAEMKTFMLKQLRESIDFDCSDYPLSATHLSGEAWLTSKREHAAKNIGRYTVEHEKEVERTNSRNAWITALYASLPDSVSRNPEPQGEPKA